MNNTGFILAFAYPETVVRTPQEWYSPFLHYMGIGKRNYVRAGHAALVLIHKETGFLEYHDFGRYIVPTPYGRVRGQTTDHELAIPLKAEIKNNKIQNLNEILLFFATNPKVTHGEGKMIASVCDSIDYSLARSFIDEMQSNFVRYAAFIKNASNCSRFVTDTLIASVTNSTIRKRLIKSKWFTPSTIGNVVKANSGNGVYEISGSGKIKTYNSTIWKDNKTYFLDKLNGFRPTLEGNLEPKYNAAITIHAQWLSGIGIGAWFELFETNYQRQYKFRRVSSYGDVDVHGMYEIDNDSFNYHELYNFEYNSNCKFFHIKQKDTIYRFNLIKKIN